MTIIIWLSLLVVIAALAGVWRARARGAAPTRQALIILAMTLVAVGFTAYIVRGG